MESILPLLNANHYPGYYMLVNVVLHIFQQMIKKMLTRRTKRKMRNNFLLRNEMKTWR